MVKERRRRGQGGESQRVEEKRNGRLVGAVEISGQLSERRKLQRKNLNILGLPKRKEWPQCHKVSSWQGRHSRLCQNEKEQSDLSRLPDCEIRESQGEREPNLGERVVSEREHGEEKVHFTEKEGRFQGGEEGQAKRTSLEAEGSMSG